jgi:hypothetical protein
MTFSNNDGNHSAASALNRVRTVAESECFTEVVRGTCNPKLLAKAMTIRKNMHYSRIQTRNLMNTASLI